MFDSFYLDGTTDIAVHQLQENKTLAELIPASSREWVTNVNKAYREFLEDIFGSSVLEAFESDPDNSLDCYDLWLNFELNKRRDRNSEIFKKRVSIYSDRINLFVPLGLVEVVKEQKQMKGTSFAIIKTCIRESKYCNTGRCSEAARINVPIEIFENFFRPTINEIVDHLSKIFRDGLDSGVKTILFVGGFSEYELVQELLKRRFGNTKRLVFLHDASLVVLKGAVYFGHCKDFISPPVAIFTYGFEIWSKFDKSKHSINRKEIVNGQERCRDVFLRIVTKGDLITPGLKKSQFFKPLEAGENVLEFGVFVSNQRNPVYVDDPGCVKLGTVAIPLTKNERLTNVEIEESIIFEENYIKVTAYNCKTKQKNERIFDLLSPEVRLPSKQIEM